MGGLLRAFSTPQLERLHSGKVRDSFRVGPEVRMIVVTDRISAFDKVLRTPIPDKGAVLNQLSRFWFERTRKIVPNHLLRVIDPNISLVKEARPIPVEMVVRGFLAGSMWRGYEKGKRVFSGQQVPDGLALHQRFPEALVTPTTKEASDREMSPAELVREGFVDEPTYRRMSEISLALFALGSRLLAERGIILADTKYEFGLVEGELTLIDEIHTPDSSRFWSVEDHAVDPAHAKSLDKEFARSWLRAHRTAEGLPGALPEEVVAGTAQRYQEIFSRITDTTVETGEQDLHERIRANLVREGLIQDAFVAVVMGSAGDLEHANQIVEAIRPYGVMTELRVVSAHKNGEDLVRMAEDYNHTVEPGVVVAVAGLSNGLGGALAANLNIPVISCPPFEDRADLMLNLPSSLMLPSKAPAATVIRPQNAAQFALRALNLPRLRQRLGDEIQDTKAALRAADLRVRGR